MIIRWPGCKQGHVDDGLHYNLDLGPTLADMLNVEPAERWEGSSYARTITDGADCGRDQLIVSQCAHVAQRGVRFGQWMYMRTWHDGFHLFPDEMLFDVEADPHEQNDLAEARPDVVADAAGRLATWHEEMMSSQPEGYEGIDPMQTVLDEDGPYHARGHLAAYCERLRQTHRADAAEQLRKRHPQEFRRET